MFVLPSPFNPFAVDHEYFASLPMAERVIATGGTANFLQETVADCDDSFNERG